MFFSGVPPPLTEWAVPQQSKLKYTQLFNSQDRTRTGFLTGAQVKNILIGTGLSQPVLAQIWYLFLDVYFFVVFIYKFCITIDVNSKLCLYVSLK